jgi:hypothetical protein
MSHESAALEKEKKEHVFSKRRHLIMRYYDVMEKPGVEPGTFST